MTEAEAQIRPDDAELVDSAPEAPPAATSPAIDNPLPEDRYLNRELSWLDFNARVLALAADTSLPLLERAKFLAIFASNLDEFYMVRVAGLKRRDEMGLSVRSADGLSPREQLRRISERTQQIASRHAHVFLDSVRPALADEGIVIVTWAELDDDEHSRLSTYFHEQVFPVLTPLAVDPAHPFPFVSGLSLNLAITVKQPENGGQHFARIKVPDNVDRFVELGAREGVAGVVRFLPLEELIAAFLPVLFPGLEIVEHHAFRITRNADFEVEEDRDEDLLQAMERELARRRFGSPVRLEVADDMTENMLELLLRELDVNPGDVVEVPGLLDLSSLWQIYGVDRPALKDPPFVPATPPAFGERETPKSIFATLRDGDVLVHHPYDSFSTTVQRFIEQAAADPNVLAIKQTLYRTSGDSPIVNALIDAAEAGKQVVALVEIKARFDEQANIKWAKALEDVGVHVVYGLIGLKTHCKTALVVRREGSTIRRYCHIGTGNYNPKTARLYEDVGLVDRRARYRCRPHRPVQLADRLLAQGVLPQPLGRAVRGAQGHHRTHRTRDRRHARRRRRADPAEGQRLGGRAGDRRAVPRLAVRGARRGGGPRHLRAAPRRSRLFREHRRAVDPRPVPRTLADYSLPRHRRVLDRQRRHDAS